MYIVQIYILYLKGQSTRFLTISFIPHPNRPGLLTNGLKYFRIWFRFRPDIRNFGSEKLRGAAEVRKNSNISAKPKTKIF